MVLFPILRSDYRVSRLEGLLLFVAFVGYLGLRVHRFVNVRRCA